MGSGVEKRDTTGLAARAYELMKLCKTPIAAILRLTGHGAAE